MKRILCLVVIISMIIVGKAYAQSRLTANASPQSVELTVTSATQEVTFPFPTRDVSVFNYDTDDGLWINWRGGDTEGRALAANEIYNRFYLGPSSVITLSDFITSQITLIYDGVFTDGTASPVSVIATY